MFCLWVFWNCIILQLFFVTYIKRHVKQRLTLFFPCVLFLLSVLSEREESALSFWRLTFPNSAFCVVCSGWGEMQVCSPDIFSEQINWHILNHPIIKRWVLPICPLSFSFPYEQLASFSTFYNTFCKYTVKSKHSAPTNTALTSFVCIRTLPLGKTWPQRPQWSRRHLLSAPVIFLSFLSPL